MECWKCKSKYLFRNPSSLKRPKPRSSLNRNHRGDIEVSDFLSMLNPIEAPCKPLQPLNIKHDICFFTPYRVTGNLIDWDKLLASIDLESSLTTQT